MINLRAYLFTILLLGLALSLSAQPLATTELLDFNTLRLQQQRTAMLVLGGWATANIATGLALRSSRMGADRYFYEMNAYWNVVNLGIAAFGYWSAARTDPAALDLAASLNEHHGFQKILLFNAGLDVGYMLGGAYLIERARRADVNADRLRGFGRAIILQGGFLFAFDLVNYYLQARQNATIGPLLGATSEGVGLIWRF